MSRKPYKITSPAAPAKPASEAAAPPAGALIVGSRNTGNPLPTAADFEARRQGHTPAIPWPPAGPVTNYPQK